MQVVAFAAIQDRRSLLLADDFRSRLIVMLPVEAILAGTIGDAKIGDAKDAVVVLLNAPLGFVQECRADPSLAALRGMLVTTARARRDSFRDRDPGGGCRVR